MLPKTVVLEFVVIIFLQTFDLSTASNISNSSNFSATKNIYRVKSSDFNKQKINETAVLEKVKFELNSLISELKAYVHEKWIDFASFEDDQEQIKEKVYHASNYARLQRPSAYLHYGSQYVRWFYFFMRDIIEMRKYFDDCDYWGYDLVEAMAKLNIQMLASYKLGKESLNFDNPSSRSFFEFKFDVLRLRAQSDIQMSDFMRTYFESQKRNAEAVIADMREYKIDDDSTVCPQRE